MSKTGKKQRADQDAAEARIEREQRELSLALGDDAGFRLLIATYNDVPRRDELIQQIIEEQTIPVALVDLSDADPEGSFVPLLQSHIGKRSIKAAMVVGMEELLDYQRADVGGLAIFETANLQRELLAKELPINVVLWLSPPGTPAFAEAAPDLWHWRAGSFDFSGHGDERTKMLRDIVDWRSRRDLVMRGTERRAHAASIENLLKELDSQPTPRSANELSHRANLLTELGNTYADLGEPRRAIEHHEQALVISREIGDRWGEGNALGNLGLAYADLAEPRRAIELYEQQLVITREIGDRRGEGNALGNLGLAYADLAEPRRAIELYEQWLVITRRDRRSSGRGECARLSWPCLCRPRRAAPCHRAL